jgi:ELWxxDGT repeat protein
MPAKRILSAALALLLVAAIPARATSVPTLTVIDTINPGAGSSSAMDSSDSAALGDYLYFQADDGTHGDELWRTNGTTTTLVEDINSGSNNSNPEYFAALGDYLYFRADDGAHGTELWRTDGTTTSLVEDINTGSNGSYPEHLTALNGYLYFQADDGTNGNELWRTDGTEAGTTRVKDINSSSGSNGSYPEHLTALNGYLYFQAYDDTNGNELWRTYVTESGTTLVKDINLSGNSYPYGFTALNGYLYFQAYDGTNGYELWRTNGTEAGTTLVENIRSGGAGSYPDYFTALGDYLYFQADDGTTLGLWRTDGTVTESVPFPVAGQSINCDCYEANIIAVGARLYTTVESSATGHEFAYLDEPTYVLPETNRDGSPWTVTLVILAGLTAAASIGLRVRNAKRA